MAVTLVLLVTVVCLFTLVYYHPKRAGMPPGPKGVPFFGSLFSLLFECPLYYFDRLSKQYGPICSVQFGLQRVVVISSREWMQEVCVRQGSIIDQRPHGTMLSFIAGGKGVILTDGEAHRSARKITLQVLRDHGLGRNNIEDYVNLEVQTLISTLKTKTGKSFDIRHDLATTMLNIVWHMFVGERFAIGDPILKWLITSIDKTAALLTMAGFMNFVPFLRFPGTFLRPLAFEVLISLIYRIKYFSSIISQHRSQSGDPSKEHDLVYAYLQKQNEQKRDGKPLGVYRNFQLIWLLSDLFVAGLDTSVSTLRFAILFLIKKPFIMENLQREIDEVIGTDRSPSLNDRDKMPYMQAFISEALRYTSVVPLASHATSVDTTLGPYKIPKHTVVFTHIRAIHFDPNVWKDPEDFRPDRFLSPSGEYVSNVNLVPFSIGRRNCLGESLARAEIFLLLSSVLQQMNFLPAQHIPDSTPHYGLFSHPPEFEVVVEMRDKDLQRSSATTRSKA